MCGARSNPSSSRGYFFGWIGPTLVALAFAMLTIWSWRKWPDLLIDFGRELYVPWQLIEGKVLYRDIAYFNGPLSPYLNALWFRLFGVSLTTLIFCNLVILAFTTSLIYHIIKGSCDKITATLSCIAFLSVFAFGHMAFVGNYNYICPYSHELTHGIFLSSLMIMFLSHSIKQPRFGLIILSGLCLGLIFLGKAEVFVAASAAATVGILLTWLSNQLSLRQTGVYVLLFLTALLTPAATFFLCLWAKMPAAQALYGIARTWTSLLSSSVFITFFYQVGAGLDHPWQNIAIIIRSFLSVTLLIGACICFNRVIQQKQARLKYYTLGVFFFLGGFLFFQPPLLLFNRSLQLTTFFATAAMTAFCIKNRHDKAAVNHLAPLAMWGMLGIGLLAKIILTVRIWQYGFVLAMPASIFLVVVLMGLMPPLISKLQGRGDWFRLFVFIIIVLDIMCFSSFSYSNYVKKDYWIGKGTDSFLTYGGQVDPRGPAVKQLLEYIDSTIPPRDTFAVVPEGVMINYLTRRINPTPYINFMPPEMQIFGESRILESFKANPPDYVIWVPKDTREYGVGSFGTDPHYGKTMMAWIDANYLQVWQPLAEPLESNQFGIKIMKRKP